MGEVGYRAQSWEGFRRVVMKAEVMPEGTNRRFVVTNLLAEPKELYDFYVRRGEVENRIKDLKLGLAADRLSCHRFLANQMRLLLHAAAYVLMHTIRQLLGGTELAGAQFDTIRLRLLKIGARVRQTARRIWVHLASSYPGRELWEHLHAQLLLLTPAPKLNERNPTHRRWTSAAELWLEVAEYHAVLTRRLWIPPSVARAGTSGGVGWPLDAPQNSENPRAANGS